jgi:hypothetical protein
MTSAVIFEMMTVTPSGINVMIYKIFSPKKLAFFCY